jgi:hypothetical protein
MVSALVAQLRRRWDEFVEAVQLSKDARQDAGVRLGLVGGEVKVLGGS